MIGIIGAMKVELEALKARLQDVTVTRISGVDFYSGKLHGTDVVATVSGVGKVFAAVCAQTMVLKFGVKAIINTGVAGGLSPNLKLGEVAIASQVCQHDMDTSGVGDPSRAWPGGGAAAVCGHPAAGHRCLDRHAGGVHPGYEVQGCAGGLHGRRIAGRDHHGSGQCGPVGCVERSVCRGLMAQTCRRFVVEIAHSISAPSVLE